MSDLSATQCGCGKNGMFGFGGGSCSCIIILLLLFSCCGNGLEMTAAVAAEVMDATASGSS